MNNDPELQSPTHPQSQGADCEVYEGRQDQQDQQVDTEVPNDYVVIRRRGHGLGRQAGRGLNRGRVGNRGCVRGRNRSAHNFDLNRAPLVILDLNAPPDEDGESIGTEVVNYSRVDGNCGMSLQGQGRGRGRGRRRGQRQAASALRGCGNAPATTSGRGRGRARGHGCRSGRGRGIHDDDGLEQNLSGSDGNDSSDSPVVDPPPGWSAPMIHPTIRSPHVLRHPRPRLTETSSVQIVAPRTSIEGSSYERETRMVDAFTTSARVRQWLQRQSECDDHNRSTGTDQHLPRLEGPFGSFSGRSLPAIVWVPLELLGYNSAEWGGLQEFVGEPQQRWQENGVSFFFIDFRGNIGGKKVRVCDCRYVPGIGEEVGNLHTAGPSQIQADSDSIPEFPTQRLDEEPSSAPVFREDIVASDVEVHAEPAEEEITNNESSSESDWRADWRDFAGDDSSLDNCDSESQSDNGSIDLHHEIGYYEGDGDLDDLDFRARYHDRFWQSPETTLLGDQKSFRGAFPGPKARVTRQRQKPIHFFDLFFDKIVVQKMVEQTNLYASQQGTGRSEGSNGGHMWVQTTSLEIRAFVGVSILMGMKVLPSIRDYWKDNEFLHCTLIPRVFTRNMFESLL